MNVLRKSLPVNFSCGNIMVAACYRFVTVLSFFGEFFRYAHNPTGEKCDRLHYDHSDTTPDDKLAQNCENNGIDKEGQNRIDLLLKKI